MSDLIERLRYLVSHDARLSKPRIPQHVWKALLDGSDALDQQAVEIDRLKAGRDQDRAAMLEFAQKAALDAAELEAENTDLRNVIDRARRVMRGEGISDQGEAWDKCLHILDAAMEGKK